MKMSLRQWYGNSIHIPRFTDVWFNYFVATSMGIVRSIIQDNLDKSIYVRFGSVGTASANIEKGIINIEENFLKGKFIKGKPNLDSDPTIVCLMGIVVHEAAHFAYSPATLLPWGTYIKKNLRPGIIYSENVAHTIGNIVEDIYIEAEINRTLPLLSWTLDALNEVFFPEEEYLRRQEKVRGLEESPRESEDLSNLLNFLICAKTRDESDASVFVDELFSHIHSASKLKKLQDRMELALQVYQQVMANMEAKDLPVLSLAQIESESLGAGASHNNRDAYRTSKNQQAAEMDSLCEGTENTKLRLPYDYAGASTSTIFFQEEAVKPSAVPLIADLRYMQLAEIARQRASVNRPYGLDKKRGHNIRKLYRIATDQQIFAAPVKVNTFAPMQVMVLVDNSGSMMWGSGSKQPVQLALEAGIGTVYALSDGRCSVALYAHTADTGGLGNNTMLYRLKGFNEPVHDIASKAAALCDYDYFHSGNRDGDAILYVSKLFLGQQTRRMLIVISDGQPNASGYTGMKSINHTKSVVDGLRESGIDVLSISIEEEANRINNLIYGERNNVFNENPNVIQQIIEKILTE